MLWFAFSSQCLKIFFEDKKRLKKMCDKTKQKFNSFGLNLAFNFEGLM
jgi:hypothetical protein